MKRIYYASGSLLTGDDIADVLVRFAAALAHKNDAAEVRAPVVIEGGGTGEALMLLGPASQILAEDEPYSGPELLDEPFVAEFEDKIAALGPQKATYVEHGTDDIPDLDYDLL
ncbi:hypothetical protein [Leifsonia shinshuensis]|uniref:hypothetical protein n=1 Tax=Leifsonia shinshuensis TaxID=150026 RepID=UPI002862DEF3|nr:hypothetical protein [Leifsonia shinshuensis]MDR6972176.1 hypothetical protein [Leifsonia shinshuensis]